MGCILCITNFFNFDDFNPDASIERISLVVLLEEQDDPLALVEQGDTEEPEEE